MKRFNSSDSLGAMISMCPNTTTDEESPSRNMKDHVYGFQSMLDDEDYSGHVTEKKRRLGVDQVKALEKNFELENKLEPERKVKLAQELGLQPRQVAVWFQNRRARWKTKQLERDYGVLKADYDSLKLNYESLQRDNEALLNQIRELKGKLNEEENSESNLSTKESENKTLTLVETETETQTQTETETEPLLPPPTTTTAVATPTEDVSVPNELNYENFNGVEFFPNENFKDGSSDSDSSAVLNEENNNGGSNVSMFQFPVKNYNTQFVKLEEHNFFSSEEACNFFSDEQAPTLQWYCPDQWNGGNSYAA